MAHEIHEHDTLVLSRKPAWHGLGTIIPNDIPIADGLRLSGLDWNIIESDRLFGKFDAEQQSDDLTDDLVHMHPTDQWKMLLREDTRECFAVVSDGYMPFQNHQLFDLAKSLNEECQSSELTIESAGSLMNGRRVWILLKGHEFEVHGKQPDVTYPYLLLANSHDGTIALTGMPTWIRVVCNNTLSASLEESSETSFRFRHTARMLDRISEMKSLIKRFNLTIDRDKNVLNALACTSVNRELLQDLWTEVLMKIDGPIDPPTSHSTEDEIRTYERRKTKLVNGLCHMTNVFDRESQQFGANLYVAMNAMTNWIEHGRGSLTGDARINARLFGSYREARNIAVKSALSLVH